MEFEDRFVNGYWWGAKEQQEAFNEIQKKLPNSIYEEDGQKYILAKEIIKPLPEWHPIRLAFEMAIRGENGNVPYEVKGNVRDEDIDYSIKELESLGYEKEETGASYSFTDPAWILKQDNHYGYDWGDSLEV